MERASSSTSSPSNSPSKGVVLMSFSDEDYVSHPHDCSVVTFRGHSVLKTLIRCHFSPAGSTDSRYVYTGSEDGGVYIYNMDATLKAKIDVNSATRDSRRRDPSLYHGSIDLEDQHSRSAWKTCVRDASWHPAAPMIAGKCNVLDLDIGSILILLLQQLRGTAGACPPEPARFIAITTA